MIKIPEELQNEESKEKNNAMLKKFIIGLVGIFISSIIWIGSPDNPWIFSDLFVKGHFVRTGDVNYIHRFGESATLLKDGRVLVVGGFTKKRVKEDPDTAGAEIYKPKTGRFYSLGNTIYPRHYHTATLLNDGRVLLAGGLDIKGSRTAEIFDPETNKFYSLGNMPEGYADISATLLKDGRILLAEEIFDPKTYKFYLTGKMHYPRNNYTATLLKDGRVLITGGDSVIVGITSTAEIYDPDTGKFTLTGSMNYPRFKHTAALLPDGKVLIAGGYSSLFKSAPSESSNFVQQPEIYNPVTGAFTKLNGKFYPYAHIVTTLKDDKLLLTMYDEEEDSVKAVVYDPRTGKSRLSGHKDSGGIATLLQNGNVLFLGGDSKKAELYIP